MKRIYSNWLAAYGAYTRNTEAPEHFNFWVAVNVLASVVGRKLVIDQGHFQWVPNFFIAMVAKAGIATKSTAIGIGEDLMRNSGKVKFASNSSTWQALVEEMSDARQSNFEDFIPHCTLTIVSSELGTFLDLENREQVEFLTETWDARNSIWVRRTVGGRTEKHDGRIKKIENPCLNLIGATTPNWIKNNYKQDMVGGGFSSRLIMVMADKKQRNIAYPALETPLDKTMREELIEDLKVISEMRGEMRLTKDATDWGTQWYNAHYDRPQLRQLQGEQFEGYYARKQTHMHKLAMLFAVSRGSMDVDLCDLLSANKTLRIMERDMGKLMGYAQAKGFYGSAKVDVYDAIRAAGKVERDQLYADFSIMLTGKDFDRILGDLARVKWIGQLQAGGKIWVTDQLKPRLVVNGDADHDEI